MEGSRRNEKAGRVNMGTTTTATARREGLELREASTLSMSSSRNIKFRFPAISPGSTFRVISNFLSL